MINFITSGLNFFSKYHYAISNLSYKISNYINYISNNLYGHLLSNMMQLQLYPIAKQVIIIILSICLLKRWSKFVSRHQLVKNLSLYECKQFIDIYILLPYHKKKEISRLQVEKRTINLNLFTSRHIHYHQAFYLMI